MIVGELSFGIGTVVAAALVIVIICLLFRKGYQPDKDTRHLTSVAAAAAK